MKNVLITGATGAIGYALAVAYAKNGFNVIANYSKNSDKAHQLEKMLTDKYKVKALAMQADVSSSYEVNKMIETATSELGGIDVLVNNAGIAQQKLFTEITDDEWNKMISVNLGGVFNCCRAVLPEMIRNHRGSILNISSMWGQVGASCEVHYSASKAGIIGLTKALAKEVGPSNIAVNCIAPGVIKSHMLDQFTEDDLKALEEETPLGRLGTPEDVADMAVFLTSSKASFITGQIIGVNGGFVI